MEPNHINKTLAKQIEKIIADKFEERSGYDDKLKIREAAQDVAAAFDTLQPVSGLVEALEASEAALELAIPMCPTASVELTITINTIRQALAQHREGKQWSDEVPREPTEEMADCEGVRRSLDRMPLCHNLWLGRMIARDNGITLAKEIYRAMLQAAQGGKGGEG